MLDVKTYNEVHDTEPVVLTVLWGFMIASVIFFVNMLVAQLTCAYDSVYADMVGYARLNRILIIVEPHARGDSEDVGQARVRV